MSNLIYDFNIRIDYKPHELIGVIASTLQNEFRVRISRSIQYTMSKYFYQTVDRKLRASRNCNKSIWTIKIKNHQLLDTI